MTHRFAWGMLPLGVALACAGRNELSDAGVNVGGAGSGHSAGSSAAGASGEVGSPDDETPGGAGGVAGEPNAGGAGGEGGLASVYFWTEATQAISIDCFGFINGSATFRADRTQLSAAQLELLTSQTGVPGSTYNDNDDAIHCVVTTTDAGERQRQFTIDQRSDLIERETNVADGGAGGDGDGEEFVVSVLGCEFHDPWSGERYPPFSANPLCVREISPDGKESSFGLKLAIPGKPYHIELVHCTPEPVAGTTVELFGVDPGTPLATGVTPDDPGRDQACFVLDVHVDAPVVGRLVISSPSQFGPGINWLTFR